MKPQRGVIDTAVAQPAAPRVRRLGRTLIEAVKEWAIAAGYPRLGLGVTTTNEPAIALYERLGFIATGDRYPLRAGSDLMFQIMVMPLARATIEEEAANEP